jgi:hypothetical protein
VQESARQAKGAELVSQLNSVVGTTLYAKALAGNNGSIEAFLGAQAAPKNTWSYYTEVPSNFTVNAVTNIAASTSTGAAAAPILSDATNSIYIYCRDGNATDTPRFWYSTKSAAIANDFNISKASF